MPIYSLVTKPTLIILMLPFQYNRFLFVDMIGWFLREGGNKTNESVIMIIRGRVGGGGLRGWRSHPLRIFFQCPKPSCFALLIPKTNFVLNYKSQFHTNFNICDHIDLASSPYFSKMNTYVLCIFWVNLTQNISKVCFRHYQNLSQNIPDYPIIKKTARKK